MRTLILLVFITLLSCSKNEPAAGNEPFKKLSFDLSTNFSDSIAKKISPGKDYTYWAYCSLRQSLSGEEKRTIISRGGDSLQKFEADPNKPVYGLFRGGTRATALIMCWLTTTEKRKLLKQRMVSGNF